MFTKSIFDFPWGCFHLEKFMHYNIVFGHLRCFFYIRSRSTASFYFFDSAEHSHLMAVPHIQKGYMLKIFNIFGIIHNNIVPVAKNLFIKYSKFPQLLLQLGMGWDILWVLVSPPLKRLFKGPPPSFPGFTLWVGRVIPKIGKLKAQGLRRAHLPV